MIQLAYCVVNKNVDRIGGFQMKETVNIFSMKKL